MMNYGNLTFRGAWIKASSLLNGAGTKDPKFEAEFLLRKAASLERHQLFLQLDDPLPEDVERVYWQWISRRCEHVPVQYIVGEQEFYGRDFYVDSQVLIPRPETELLVEQALNHAVDGATVLDIGTGSGAIAITIALESRLAGKRVSIHGVDISEGALSVACSNASRLMAEDICFHLADIWPSNDTLFDLIVSNPPYIDREDWLQMDREVKEYEPETALFAPEQGLAFYRRIVREAGAKLRKGGWLGFEIGYRQADAVKQMLLVYGYEDIDIYKDLAGHSRIIFARMV